MIAIRDDRSSSALSNAERALIGHTAATSSSARGQQETTPRADGRRRRDRRPVRLELTRADNRAAATVRLGAGTRVTATCAGELGPPASGDRPGEGSVALRVDLSPAAGTAYGHAAPASSGGGGGAGAAAGSSSAAGTADRHQKLAANRILRCLERCLLQGGALDAEALCVVPGRFVWKLQIAVTVLDDAGNLTDAAVLACLAALRHYRKPCTELAAASSSSSSSSSSAERSAAAATPRLLSANVKEPTPLPLHHTPLTITFALFPNRASSKGDDDGDDDDGIEATTGNATANATSFLIDPTRAEEICQAGCLTIGMNAHHEICLVDFSGGCEVAVADLRECHRQAAQHIQPLCQSLETALQQGDERALQQRLQLLQQQQQQQQAEAVILPPLPDSDPGPPPPPPGVPFWEQVGESAVPTDGAADRAAAAAAATAAEEAYRRQALDYNVGHVASKVREDGRNKSQQHKAAAAAAATTGSNSSGLLAAMLQSVQGAGNIAAGSVPMHVDGEITKASPQPKQGKELPPDGKSLAPRNEPTDTDDEEETTMQLQSEFQSVLPAAAPPLAKAQAPPGATSNVDSNNGDDDDVDDLAAAIKTKKKKKKSKKK